ncbi:unnamed protein product, partial [Ectocarpus sp. 12 AP-2014]
MVGVGGMRPPCWRLFQVFPRATDLFVLLTSSWSGVVFCTVTCLSRLSNLRSTAVLKVFHAHGEGTLHVRLRHQGRQPPHSIFGASGIRHIWMNDKIYNPA